MKFTLWHTVPFLSMLPILGCGGGGDFAGGGGGGRGVKWGPTTVKVSCEGEGCGHTGRIVGILELGGSSNDFDCDRGGGTTKIRAEVTTLNRFRSSDLFVNAQHDYYWLTVFQDVDDNGFLNSGDITRSNQGCPFDPAIRLDRIN